MQNTKATVSETEVKTEVVKAPRTFRSHAEVENFYRFVYENDLRKEAHLILKHIMKKFTESLGPKKRNKSKKDVQ